MATTYVERLCSYFGCEVGGLVEYVSEQPKPHRARK